LKNVTILGSVTNVGHGAFCGCSSLTDFAIPKGIDKIITGMFWGCTSLTNVRIPEGITVIESSAFQDCKNLTSVTIPKSVASIAYLAFYNCPNLTEIHFEGTVDQWNAIEKDTRWNLNSPIKVVRCSDGTVNLG
jgi:hypothetical protein